MSKQIRMKIKSTRFEMPELLFAQAVSEMAEDMPEIKITEEMLSAAEGDEMEINTDGTLSYNDGRVEFSYDESEITGMEGSTTAVHFDLDNPGFVTIYRSGTVSTTLAFERGKRHHCAYNTPIMPFEICVRTIKVENNILEDGTLRLDYVIEIRGAKAERTKFELKVIDL